MAAKKNTTATDPQTVSDILTVTTGTLVCHILGTSPIILNRLSNKAKHELLMPRGRKSAGEKATTLKHDPYQEFRDSPHRFNDDRMPTYLALPATAFKRGLGTAALDLPGTRKAQIGRLAWVNGEHHQNYIDLYGVPKLHMAPVRSADMNRTPDIRTRAALETWACKIVITFVQPLIRAQAIANLLAAAGITCGIGDWRQEKGSGSFGQFKIVAQDDPEFLEILKSGRDVQLEAMKNAVCYDDESTELLSWFVGELSQRKLKGVA